MGNMLGHVIGCHARCFRGQPAATVEEVCFKVSRNKMATAKRKKLLAADFTVISETRRIR